MGPPPLSLFPILSSPRTPAGPCGVDRRSSFPALLGSQGHSLTSATSPPLAPAEQGRLLQN